MLVLQWLNRNRLVDLWHLHWSWLRSPRKLKVNRMIRKHKQKAKNLIARSSSSSSSSTITRFDSVWVTTWFNFNSLWQLSKAWTCFSVIQRSSTLLRFSLQATQIFLQISPLSFLNPTKLIIIQVQLLFQLFHFPPHLLNPEISPQLVIQPPFASTLDTFFRCNNKINSHKTFPLLPCHTARNEIHREIKWPNPFKL